MLNYNISKMFIKSVYLAFVVIILNLQVIYSESEDHEFPIIDYNYISNDDSKPNICDQKTIVKKLELLENNLNNKIKEAIDCAFQTMANKNNNEMKDVIEQTFARKLELLENNLNTKIKEAIANDSAIANLTNVVETMSQKLTKLENALERQTQQHNNTALQTNNKGNETNSVRRVCEADTSDSCLLTVTVPSSVRAGPDVWRRGQIPEEDDLDKFMKNTTGCEYMARGYSGPWQLVSNSTARGGTWRRRLAVRGAEAAAIRVTWDARHDYKFYIGLNANTETSVWDNIQHKTMLKRATPYVMSKEKYTQFLYLQLADGVMSFGALGESTPWWRHDVTVSAGDVVRMKYDTASGDGVKLLVCA